LLPECAAAPSNALLVMTDATNAGPAPAEIKVRDSGPYRVSGSFALVDADGNAYRVEGPVALCRCGGSATKPFCDGTHRTNGFTATERASSQAVS
jgi:CDGSH iron-sulfur domain-containing protein 3